MLDVDGAQRDNLAMGRLYSTLAIAFAFTSFAAPSAKVLGAFPVLPLPTTLDATTPPTPPKTRLTSADAAALELVGKDGLAERLRAATDAPAGDVAESLVPLGRFTIGTRTVLLVRLLSASQLGDGQDTVALVFGPHGLSDLAVVNSSSDGEVGTITGATAVSAAGVFTHSGTSEIVVHEEGLPGVMRVKRTETLSVMGDGRLKRGPPSFEGRSGKFVDPRSKEELWVFEGQIFYRGNESKPFQALVVEPDAVRFKKSGARYALAWRSSNGELLCTDPKGTAQTFVREW